MCYVNHYYRGIFYRDPVSRSFYRPALPQSPQAVMYKQVSLNSSQMLVVLFLTYVKFAKINLFKVGKNL